MTTTPAMPEHTIGKHDHPEPHTMRWSELELAAIKRYAESYALAALQSQPAEVSDKWIREGLDVFNSCIESGGTSIDAAVAAMRAILALRPQSESAAPTVEAAREMGAKGGPVVEAERLAFEAWMAGHCWAVSPTWNGETYDDSEEDKKRKLLDPLARTTRMLWAAWRDRAALSSLRPQAVPMTDAWSWLTEANIDAYLEDYEMRGEAGDGRDACYTPTESDRALLKDFVMGLLAEAQEAAHHGITAPAGQPKE